MIRYALFVVIAVCIVHSRSEDDIDFTLQMQDGTIVTGGSKKFHSILKNMYDVLELIPDYEERLSNGYEAINGAIDEAMATGDRDAALMATSNIFWDMYEELFEAAGMKLRVTNRQPMHA